MADESTESIIASSLSQEFGADWASGDSDDAGGDTTPITTSDDTDDDAEDTSTAIKANDLDDVNDDDYADDSSDEKKKPAEKVEKEEKEEVTDDEGDDADKELEALGIKRPKKGERENKLPYTRMKKIFGNAKKKWDEGNQVVIKGHTDKIAAHESLLGKYQATDNLIRTDSDRFMRVLAHMDPNYQKFVDFLDKKTTSDDGGKTTATADTNDPKPGPDFTYPDGSKGFTPEQLEKREAWNVRQAVREARQGWEKDIAPFRESEKARQKAEEERKNFEKAQTQRSTHVSESVSRAKKIWGEKTLVDNKDAIIAKLNEDKTLDFGDAVAAVMYPKLSASRDTIHAELVTELKDRPAAAAKTTETGTTKKVKTDMKDMTTEEVIMASLREQGLMK